MPLFAATIFLSATLLFLVQPMVGKMLLPLAGGSSAVWNTCMVTFQAALLAGYLYSHLLTTRLSLKAQVAVHATLALLTIRALPFDKPLTAPPADSTLGLTLWLIQTIALTVGLPFFVVSTTGPLLQRWFSRTDHPRAADPYFLYAASNIGSSLGLLGYPFLLEAEYNIAGQSFIWAACFVLLAALLIACGVAAIRSQSRQIDTPAPAAPEPLAWRRRSMWVLLSAVPSSLMIGVTQHISTDLAAVPLLWVIPLFLYLLTFTLAFSPRVPLSASLLGVAVLFLVLADGFTIMTGLNKPFIPILILHITTFFVAALMCHRRLADDRPSPARLTEFFFYVALGGVLGGIFNALLAPLLFTLVYEYPVALAACVLLRPWRLTSLHADDTPNLRERLSAWCEDRKGIMAACFAAAAALALVWFIPSILASMNVKHAIVEGSRGFTAIALCLILALLVRRPIVSALPFLAVVVAGQYLGKVSWGDSTLALKRSFFGVHHVFTTSVRNADGSVDASKPIAHQLHHGTTLHGVQLVGTLNRQRPDGSTFASDAARFPTSYYHQRGPVGDMMRHLSNTIERRAAAGPSLAGLIETSRAGLLADLAGASTFPSLSLGTLAAWPAVVQASADATRSASPASRVAIVGLGSGGITAYAEAGDHYTYYEIDPAVRDIATNPTLFSYITDARKRGATIDIVLGDGRLTIADAPDKSFGLIILDAFSSDSIPVHLLTVEALDLYVSKLRDDGVLAFHISNRYFDLRPVLLAHSIHLKNKAYLCESGSTSDPNAPRGITPARDDAEHMAPSTWVVLAKTPTPLANFAADAPWWQPLDVPPEYMISATGRPARKTLPEWTDDFSDVLSIFRWTRD